MSSPAGIRDASNSGRGRRDAEPGGQRTIIVKRLLLSTLGRAAAVEGASRISSEQRSHRGRHPQSLPWSAPDRGDSADDRATVLRRDRRGGADPRRRTRRLPWAAGGGHGGGRELAAVAAVVDGRAVGHV